MKVELGSELMFELNGMPLKLVEEDLMLVYNMRRIVGLIREGKTLYGPIKILNKNYKYRAWQMAASDRFYVEFVEEK